MEKEEIKQILYDFLDLMDNSGNRNLDELINEFLAKKEIGINSKGQEPIDEEKLNKLALQQYAPWAVELGEDEYILDDHNKLKIDAYITGYRKAMEA